MSNAQMSRQQWPPKRLPIPPWQDDCHSKVTRLETPWYRPLEIFLARRRAQAGHKTTSGQFLILPDGFSIGFSGWSRDWEQGGSVMCKGVWPDIACTQKLDSPTPAPQLVNDYRIQKFTKTKQKQEIKTKNIQQFIDIGIYIYIFLSL